MLRKNYYCLIAGLPDLVIDGYRKGLTSLTFKQELDVLLNRADHHLMELFYRKHDHKNLLNLLLHKDLEFNTLGNYTKDYVVNQLLNPTGLEEYMKLLITDFKSVGSNRSALELENQLLELFYNDVLKENNPFVRKWFLFEQTINNILTAANCQRYGYDLKSHLIPPKIKDEQYESLLSEPQQPDLFSEDELPFLNQIYQLANSEIDASEKEKAIDNIKFSFLDELTFFNYFTIEKILSYVIKLMIVDRWRELDFDTGKKFLERLINDLEMSYSFSEEYSLTARR